VDAVTAALVSAQDGDESAFDRVVRLTCDDVRRFCTWRTGASADLDDLVQDTYVQAFRGVRTFRAESSGRTWLMTIARNVCNDHIQREIRRRDVIRLVTPLTHTGDGTDAIALAEAVSSLASEFREAFVLVRICGYSYAEAAVVIGCPVGTVQSRVARAREQLVDYVASTQLTATA
jgi:RNA polymerase sigma-70 factor (ECF subfamily)